jgi:hypothetical protein
MSQVRGAGNLTDRMLHPVAAVADQVRVGPLAGAGPESLLGGNNLRHNSSLINPSRSASVAEEAPYGRRAARPARAASVACSVTDCVARVV